MIGGEKLLICSLHFDSKDFYKQVKAKFFMYKYVGVLNARKFLFSR